MCMGVLCMWGWGVRCVGKLQVNKLSRIRVTKFYENQRPSTTIHYRANKHIIR